MSDLVQRDATAAGDAEVEAESPAETQALMAAVAMAHCAYRRVIRTRRADYSGVLPRRRHRPLVVEPLGAEADRQELMWRYFGYLGELSRQFDPILLAKRVILSPPSLEQRVDFLRRKGHERGGLLEQVKPLVHRKRGDSRADALIDLLAEVWTNDPTERVLVAAQDNLTVDYLHELVLARLPEVGPLGHRVRLKAALLRQGQTEEMLEDLGGYGNETAVNLDEFQRGDALILFAPEKAQVGLNLQRARVLVMYSVPWRPEEVEQWIGRLDRIGNEAAFSHAGEAKTIDVYTIAQRGLVDEKVVTVLQRFHVFERSVNLDGEHLEDVARLIEAAALGDEGVSWSELESETEAMAAEDEVQELESALRPSLPWTVREASSARRRIDALPPAPPTLKDLPEHSAAGPRSWDRAFEGMLKLLARAGEYHIRWNTDPHQRIRFRTLWYKFGEYAARWAGHRQEREVRAKVIFSFGADPGIDRSPRNAHAFVTRRGDIRTPPLRKVTLSLDADDVLRPLRFLSFGDDLHDQLIRGWLPEKPDSVLLDVGFPSDHALWAGGVPGHYLLRVSVIDPSSVLQDAERRANEAVAAAVQLAPNERLIELLSPFSRATRCAIEADVRWLRAQLTPLLGVDARRYEDGQWIRVDPEVTRALLNPLAHDGDNLPQASVLRPYQGVVTAAREELERMRSAASAETRAAWSHLLPQLGFALQSRLLVVREEGLDAVSIAREELRSAEQTLADARDRGNRGQITRAANARDLATDRHRMTQTFWHQRADWLRGLEQEVLEVTPREFVSALLRARQI